MKSTRQQLLRDPNIQPTVDIIEKALGEANDAYVKFARKLASRGILLEWRYYTDGKAWLAKGIYRWTGVRGGLKEMTVCWLSIWESFFKVTLYFPEKFRADINNLPLSDEIRQRITDAKQMGAKLKFFPLVFDLCSDEIFETIFTLADFKKSLK